MRAAPRDGRVLVLPPARGWQGQPAPAAPGRPGKGLQAPAAARLPCTWGREGQGCEPNGLLPRKERRGPAGQRGRERDPWALARLCHRPPHGRRRAMAILSASASPTQANTLRPCLQPSICARKGAGEHAGHWEREAQAGRERQAGGAGLCSGPGTELRRGRPEKLHVLGPCG